MSDGVFLAVWEPESSATQAQIQAVRSLVADVDGCDVATLRNGSLRFLLREDDFYLSGRTPACSHSWGYGFATALKMVTLSRATNVPLRWTQGERRRSNGSGQFTPAKGSNTVFVVDQDGRFRSAEPRLGPPQ